MKGYLIQLWNDPAFFANTMKTALSFGLTTVGGALISPVGRTLTEKLIVSAVAASGVAIASMPNAKPVEPKE